MIYDLLGVGIGPFNLGLAALLDPVPDIDAVFLEQKPEFRWHPGLLLEGTTIQVPFLADVVTMADPCSPYSFLNYLHAHSRLYQFYFFEDFHIPRREYNHYCQWVANQLASCRFSQQVEAITWIEDGSDSYFQVQTRTPQTEQTQCYQARHLALGVGTVPQVPPCFEGWLQQDNIFHAAEFLQKRDRACDANSVTVIGSGQSAAEIFYELLQDQPNHNYRLEWHTRSAGFFPMEYSKLGLEHFSPDYTEYFYQLPQQKRDVVRSKQDLLYKGISFGTIANIYDLLYERSIGGVMPDVRLISSLEVKEVEAVGSSYRLGYRQWQQEQYFQHETDCIILATGYRHAVPSCIDGLRSLIQWESQDRYVVNFDYRLALTRDIPNDIFIQNGELHTHGIGAPDLGLGAHRNAVIINTLTGRNVYPTQQRNVFQQFGVT